MDNSTFTKEQTNGTSSVFFDSTGSKGRSTIPKLFEWHQLWLGWDAVTNMIDHDTMLFEKPIDLRHPFIFYMGHIPAFLDVMLTRYKVDAMTNRDHHRLTEPSTFADIFERGIDPDMDNPNICNPHSTVPKDISSWPSVTSILQYQQLVRNRLTNLLLHWENENSMIFCEIETPLSAGRVVWMCFEHEAMHLETLLYMIVQSPNFKHPIVSPPEWYNDNGDQYIGKDFTTLDSAKWLSFDKGNVEIGTDEINEAINGCKKVIFGWDNEHPKRVVSVLPYEIQSRPVTNAEYWHFWKNADQNQQLYLPAAWHFESELDCLPKVKTSFGLCEFHIAMNWPVQVSCQQAEAYAYHKGMRLPTEPEWIRFRRTVESKLPTTADSIQNVKNVLNYGFKSWTPLALNNEEIHLLGNVWEWTSSVWDLHEGFVSSQLYPGYSADFFDGKHRVVLGASWATHPRIAERISFRNWYQWRYPFVFCGFRLCR